jgi:hypothetical protein
VRTILSAAFVAAPLVALLAACAPGKPPAEPLRYEGEIPTAFDNADSAPGGGWQRFESIARQENPK